MAIGVEQNLERHSKIAGCLPWIRALLHQPRRRSVPQRVRRYTGTEPGKPDCALECRFDGIYRLAIELDEVLGLRINPVPAPQMRK